MTHSSWIPVEFTVVIPMFLDGAGGRPEFRLPALRGAARFWFRTLAAPVFGDDFAAVARAEAEIFGAAAAEADDGGGYRGPSRIALRPRELPKPTTSARNASELKPGWLHLREDKPRPGIAYLLGPGLYKYPRALARTGYFSPGEQGTTAASGLFEVRADSTYAAEVFGICLWALAAFGGLGARTRRGFGGITFTGLDRLSASVGGDEPPHRGHPAIRRLHQLVAGRHTRPMPAVDAPPPRTYPEAPSWSRWTIRTATRQDSWTQILNDVGMKLREFRACVDRTKAPYNMTGIPPHRRWVTREYVEVVNPHLGLAPPAPSDFAIAGFGLPIVFAHGKVVDLVDGDDGDDKTLRRASPLWIRVLPGTGRTNTLLCHIFESKILPLEGQIVLKRGQTVIPPALHIDETIAYKTLTAFLDGLIPLSAAST